MRIGAPLALDTLFAANTDPAESDLTKLDAAKLKEAIPGWNFLHLTSSQRLAEDVRSVGRRGELHQQLLCGLLILLLVESILAWRFGHHDASS